MSTSKTTRQRIIEILEARPHENPTAIRDALSDYGISLAPADVIKHLKQIDKSNEYTVGTVEPPKCKDCGFANFRDGANIPSSCPECDSEWIKEPEFTIQ